MAWDSSLSSYRATQKKNQSTRIPQPIPIYSYIIASIYIISKTRHFPSARLASRHKNQKIREKSGHFHKVRRGNVAFRPVPHHEHLRQQRKFFFIGVGSEQGRERRRFGRQSEARERVYPSRFAFSLCVFLNNYVHAMGGGGGIAGRRERVRVTERESERLFPKPHIFLSRDEGEVDGV